jgi:hypothetical protein
MKLKIDPLTENPLTLMRRAGYTFQRAEGNEQSYVRELGSSGYPRFHIYTKVDKLTLFVSMHLDHKKHTYGTETRHHGDYQYEGPLKEEVDRLLTLWGESATIV